MTYQPRPPAEWMHMMQQPHELGRAFIAREVQAYLSTDRVLDVRTTLLAEVLWPTRHAIGEAIALRKRMVDLLMKCASDELADCVRKGEPTGRKFMGRASRPWLWSTPAHLGNHPERLKLDQYSPVPSELLVDKFVQYEPAAPVITEMQADREWIVNLLRVTPTTAFMPAFKLQEIADALLRKAKVIPV